MGFPRLQPLLEEVLVVAVCPGTHSEGGALVEQTCLCVDEHGHQAIYFWQLVQPLRHGKGTFLQIEKHHSHTQLMQNDRSTTNKMHPVEVLISLQKIKRARG